jgi:hypothetical protein
MMSQLEPMDAQKFRNSLPRFRQIATKGVAIQKRLGNTALGT